MDTPLESEKPVTGFDIAEQSGLPDDQVLAKTAIATAADLLDPIDALLAGSPILAKKGAQAIGKGAKALRQATKAKVNPLDLQRVSGADFNKAMRGAEELNENIKPYVHHYPDEEVDAFKAFLTPDKKSGVAVKPDGDMINVFSAEKGRGGDLVDKAIIEGARKADNFDQARLNELYEAKGMKEVDRMKFDDQYAPEGWNYEKLGRPDVIMRKMPEAKTFEKIKNVIKRKLS